MNGRNIKDITGKRFGRLVAQEPTELRRNGSRLVVHLARIRNRRTN